MTVDLLTKSIINHNVQRCEYRLIENEYAIHKGHEDEHQWTHHYKPNSEKLVSPASAFLVPMDLLPQKGKEGSLARNEGRHHTEDRNCHPGVVLSFP